MPEDLTRFWPMARRAASYLVRNGPVTQQDRWEEDAGYSPFTLAVEVAALLAAADLADLAGEPEAGVYLRETADVWNDRVEHWTLATGTDLGRQVGVASYYVRITPPEVSDAASPMEGFVAIKNRPPGQSPAPVAGIVSPLEQGREVGGRQFLPDRRSTKGESPRMTRIGRIGTDQHLNYRAPAAQWGACRPGTRNSI